MEVKFNEFDDDLKGHTRKKKHKKCPIIDLLIRKGVVKNKRQADILLVAISIVLLSLSFMISYNDRFFEFDLGNSSEEEFLYDEEQV